MNLVKLIMDLLSGDVLGKLSSLLGTETEKTERAAQAAVPSLLAAVAGMAKNDVGARKLTDVLGGLNTDNLGNVAQMFGGDTSSLLNKGTGVLNSLFGDSMVSGIAASVSRFAGLDSGTVKKLLGYLAPLVLGKVAAEWKNQGGTVSALQSLMADQRGNIADAAPAGFSLDNITRLADDYKSAAHSAGRRAEKATAGSAASWLLPLAAVLIGGFLLWRYMQPAAEEAPVARNTEQPAERAPAPGAGQEAVTVMRPELPNAGQLPEIADIRENFTGFFESLNTSFSGIQDAASAQAALPDLRDLNTRIEAMNVTISRLPEASRQALRPMLEQQTQAISQHAERISSNESIGSEVKQLIQEIVTKIRGWISA